MRYVRRYVIALLSLAIPIAGILLGIFAGAGLAAAIWGASVLDGPLGKPPDRSHPAFWTFRAVMLVGAAGAFFGLVVPLYSWSGERLSLGNSEDAGTLILRRYVALLQSLQNCSGRHNSPVD